MARDDDDYDDDDEEVSLVLFQGAMNGVAANLKANAGLVRAGLMPAKELVTDGIERHAHKVVIEPRGDRAAVVFSIDGVGQRGPALPGRRAMAVTQMLKLLSGLDPKERKKELKGGINAEFEDKKYEVYIETRPGERGQERLTIKIEDPAELVRKPVDAEMPDSLKDKIRDLTSKRSGVFLICGPAESGSSTTAFVVLHTIDSFIYSVFAIADFGNKETINITDYELEENEDIDLAAEKIIRKEGDAIFVERIEDSETAKSIFESQDRIGFIGEIKANEPVLGIQRIVELVGDPKAVAQGLSGILTQKLVRKLCYQCKEAYRPNERLLEKIGLPPKTKVLYREAAPPDEEEEEPEICEVCDGVGYRGRVAAFELLEITDDIRELIASGAEPAAIKKAARTSGMKTLQKDALRLVASGTTSLEELQRTFAPRKKPGARRRRRE